MQEITSLLPKIAQNYVKPSAPTPMKMMAASGKLPLPPQHLGLTLVCLAHDPDYNVAQKAVMTFHEQPSAIIQHLLNNNKIPPSVLHFAAQQLQNRPEFTQKIILHKQTPNETIGWMAGRVEGENLVLIAQNQKRHLEHPPLIQELLKNSKLSNEHRVRIIEFALREGLDTGLGLQEIRTYVNDALLTELGIEITEPTPIAEPVAEVVVEELEEFVLEYDIEMIDDGTPTQEELPAVNIDVPTAVASSTHEELPEVDLDTQDETQATEEDALPEVMTQEAQEGKEPPVEEKLTIEQQLLNMSVTEKIKAAIRGNKQIRGMLITSANRLISSAVLKNPRITEAEVIKIASSRSVSEDVIRGITRNREWMKLYQVKVNLVHNPKCPQGISMRLLNHLRPFELKSLVGNKNVPSLISTNAKKLLRQKQKN